MIACQKMSIMWALVSFGPCHCKCPLQTDPRWHEEHALRQLRQFKAHDTAHLLAFKVPQTLSSNHDKTCTHMILHQHCPRSSILSSSTHQGARSPDAILLFAAWNFRVEFETWRVVHGGPSGKIASHGWVENKAMSRVRVPPSHQLAKVNTLVGQGDAKSSFVFERLDFWSLDPQFGGKIRA